MFKLRIIVPLVCCSILCSCAEKYTGRHWITYTAPDRTFSLNIPQGYDTGSVTTTDEIIGRHKENYIYWRFPSSWKPEFDIKLIQLVYFDLPEKFRDSGHLILDRYIDDASGVWSKYGSIQVEGIKLQGCDAKKLTFLSTGKEDLNTATYFWKCVCKGRAWFFEVSVYNKYNDKVEVDRLFNSFRMLN